MRIACLISSLSRNAGGVFEGVRGLCQALARQPGVELHVLGLTDEYSADDAAAWAPLHVHGFPLCGPHRYGYAPGLKTRLLELEVDLLLTNGLWMYPTAVALAWHRQTRRPFIVSPHGMLEAWALRQSPWKKRIVALFHENACLQKAVCLRALNPAEARAIRAQGFTNPICVIPNGVDLPAYPNPGPATGPKTKGKSLLYLGRLHPKKGLVALLHAWSLLRKQRVAGIENWHLIIAGWDQQGHEHELKSLARRLHLSEKVSFPGPLFEDRKTAAYAEADAFILPSLSEGQPLAVLEAWAHRLPVVMTPACHLPEGLEAGAALMAEPDATSLASALQELIALSDQDRCEMGRRGAKLVAERFNWNGIGKTMHRVCQRLVQEAPAPRPAPDSGKEVHEPALV